MIEVVLLVLFFVILGIVTRAKRPAAENIAVVQERRRKGGRTKKLIGIVLLCISVVIWVVVLLTPPKQPALPTMKWKSCRSFSHRAQFWKRAAPKKNMTPCRADYFTQAQRAMSMRVLGRCGQSPFHERSGVLEWDDTDD